MDPEQQLPNSDHSWQHALNPQLMQRLLRPLVQPGVIATSMARGVIARMQHPADRLPMLRRMAQYLNSTEDVQADQLPIVYAQSIPRPANATGDQGDSDRIAVVRPIAQPLGVQRASRLLSQPLATESLMHTQPIMRRHVERTELQGDGLSQTVASQAGQVERGSSDAGERRTVVGQSATDVQRDRYVSDQATALPNQIVLPPGRRLQRQSEGRTDAAPEARSASVAHGDGSAAGGSIIQRSPQPAASAAGESGRLGAASHPLPVRQVAEPTQQLARQVDQSALVAADRIREQSPQTVAAPQRLDDRSADASGGPSAGQIPSAPLPVALRSMALLPVVQPLATSQTRTSAGIASLGSVGEVLQRQRDITSSQEPHGAAPREGASMGQPPARPIVRATSTTVSTAGQVRDGGQTIQRAPAQLPLAVASRLPTLSEQSSSPASGQIMRVVDATDTGGLATNASQPAASTPIDMSSAPGSPPAAEIDIDELVEKALHKLTRHLDVEGERRGWNPWS